MHIKLFCKLGESELRACTELLESGLSIFKFHIEICKSKTILEGLLGRCEVLTSNPLLWRTEIISSFFYLLTKFKERINIIFKHPCQQ